MNLPPEIEKAIQETGEGGCPIWREDLYIIVRLVAEGCAKCCDTQDESLADPASRAAEAIRGAYGLPIPEFVWGDDEDVDGLATPADKPMCTVCKGEGYVPCEACREGTALHRANCTSCDSTGEIACPVCSFPLMLEGTTCPNCQRVFAKPSEPVCKMCKGEKRVPMYHHEIRNITGRGMLMPCGTMPCPACGKD